MLKAFTKKKKGCRVAESLKIDDMEICDYKVSMGRRSRTASVGSLQN